MTLHKVLIVDDHELVRRGLRSILDQDPRFNLVGEATTGLEAIQLVDKIQPDLILLDLLLPDMNGIEVCERIIKFHPDIAIIILTAFIDRNRVDACLRAGARGYLLKDAENLDLTTQLMIALKGHHVLDPRATDLLTDYVRRQPAGTQMLTSRENSILRLIAEGCTNKEIGDQLNLSENTVKGHVKEILGKTSAKTRIQAVLIAKQKGIM